MILLEKFCLCDPEIREQSEIANPEGFFLILRCVRYLYDPSPTVPHTAVCNIYAIGHQLLQSDNLTDEGEKKNVGSGWRRFRYCSRFPPQGSLHKGVRRSSGGSEDWKGFDLVSCFLFATASIVDLPYRYCTEHSLLHSAF